MQDTSQEASQRYVELLRARQPSEKAAMVVSLTKTVRALAEAGVRSADPTATDREVQARVASRLYGDEVAARCFPGVALR